MTSQHSNPQRIITATEMRRHFGAIVQQLCKEREHAIIQSNGAPVAVLLPIAEYERLMAQERLAAFNKFARSLGQEVEKRGLTEEELMNELEETKHEVFLEQYCQLGQKSCEYH